ncbi:glutamate dehydrogenase [Streptomyces sp. NBRC 110611]|nr:glutamate dehydrogenase [Streptomyces sp. NBRC 110611]
MPYPPPQHTRGRRDDSTAAIPLGRLLLSVPLLAPHRLTHALPRPPTDIGVRFSNSLTVSMPTRSVAMLRFARLCATPPRGRSGRREFRPRTYDSHTPTAVRSFV